MYLFCNDYKINILGMKGPSVLLLCGLLLLVTATATNTAVNSNAGFLSVGDWGSASLGGYHLRNAIGTADAMKAYIANGRGSGASVSFVLNTGDNFYYCGIQNTSDAQITEDYTALFGGMGVPWYHSLGNHDYGFSPEAQLRLNETIPEWIMDDRYYHRRVVLPGGGSDDDRNDIRVNIIVLDTNPCVRDYRGTDRRRWDPCGTEYPDCSPIAEPCRFHENILSQDCDTQLSWAKGVFANIPDGEWVFVVGHHKAEEINVADFQSTILDNPRVHLYLNGHNHNLEHYSVNGDAKYMTTGAGGMVVIGAESGADKRQRMPTSSRHATAGTAGAVKSLWSKVITGFTSHVFTNNGTTLTTYFWDVKSNTTSLYSFDVHLQS
jgi:hypothetical protein